MTDKFIAELHKGQEFNMLGETEKLLAAYDDVIDLSVGDPDMTTPAPIIEASYRDSLAGHTHYTAFRGDPELRAEIVDGVRRTRATTRERSEGLLYDDLHRLLAPSLGWDALPSPPDSFERVGGGWLARGRGRGHRVGLCLGAGSR